MAEHIKQVEYYTLIYTHYFNCIKKTHLMHKYELIDIIHRCF